MLLRSLIAALCMCVFGLPTLGAPPRNLDCESEAEEGWFVPGVAVQNGWSAARTEKEPAEGKFALVLQREKAAGMAAGFGNVMQSFDAAPYRGKRVTLTARVRMGEKPTGRAQMWLRVDRPEDRPGAFDNMGDRPITVTEWTSATITADVDDDAESINIGFMVIGGSGPVYIDDVAVRVGERPKVRSEGPRPVTEEELANLIAFAKMYGYIRYYSPNRTATVFKDWDRVLLTAGYLDDAKTTDELILQLRMLEWIAPTMTLHTEKVDAGTAVELPPIAEVIKPTEYAVWQHHGLQIGPKRAPSIYFSALLTPPIEAPGDGVPKRGECTIRELRGPDGRAFWVRVPLTEEAVGGEPVSRNVSRPWFGDPEELSITDRASRFACVIEFWNVIQHAYPYHDVVDTHWDRVLSESLTKAAIDKTEDDFLDTLERMGAALQDGHGQVIPPRPRAVYFLPFSIAYVGDEPVITAIDTELARTSGVARGDVIVQIGERSAAELWQDAREHESSATEQFLKFRSARRMSMCRSADPVTVRVRSPVGKERGYAFTPVAFDGVARENQSPMISEPKAGIWYIDLDRVTQKDLDTVLPKLAETSCKGVIFDLRGYPSQVGFDHLGLFSDKTMQSAQWNVPIVNWPDREKIAWKKSGWPVVAKKPRFKGKAVWITDGRAISAAETYLGIVEHYGLGEIVGEATAGTNGNINPTPLPLGYSVIYTGMKVLKHDGSRHHGVGIKPTVPVERTIAGIVAGRDEMLERAIEVVEGK